MKHIDQLDTIQWMIKGLENIKTKKKFEMVKSRGDKVVEATDSTFKNIKDCCREERKNLHFIMHRARNSGPKWQQERFSLDVRKTF